MTVIWHLSGRGFFQLEAEKPGDHEHLESDYLTVLVRRHTLNSLADRVRSGGGEFDFHTLDGECDTHIAESDDISHPPTGEPSPDMKLDHRDPSSTASS